MRQRRPRPGSDNGIKCRTAEPRAPQSGLDGLGNVLLPQSRRNVGSTPIATAESRCAPSRSIPISHASFTLRHASTAVIVGVSEVREPARSSVVVSQFRRATVMDPASKPIGPPSSAISRTIVLVVRVVNECWRDQPAGASRNLVAPLRVPRIGHQDDVVRPNQRHRRGSLKPREPSDVRECGDEQAIDAERSKHLTQARVSRGENLGRRLQDHRGDADRRRCRSATTAARKRSRRATT